MSSDLTLPPAWTPPPKPPIPIVASVVPVVGAVVLWLVTGSLLSLWFAALGPLVAVATILDAARTARSARRRAAAESARMRERVRTQLVARHRDERDRLRSRHPDVAGFAARMADVWRPVPGRAGTVVAGTGDAPSEIRVLGGEGDSEATALRARAAVLRDAPVVVPAAAGIAVVGPSVLAAAVVRGLVLQLCLALPPGELRVVGPARGEAAWTAALPHRHSASGRTLAVLGPGDAVPADTDLLVVRAEPGCVPPRCAAVLTVSAPDRAQLQHGEDVQRLAVEAVGEAQATALATALADRAGEVFAAAHEHAPVMLADVLSAAPPPRRGGLPAVIGTAGGEASVIDLVADGPHAVVAGVTGSGKSELLITWVLALCATHATREVSFLLADFKGGTAFDALAGLPHVTGVLTDLDGAGARRALESLRAEVRWREAELARLGARDVMDDRVELPRLVIVVDEYAALLGAHPELGAVFADVAARGRALGMHLVLGTQRISGIVREALLANCPLRVSLRVTDPADSRAVVGSDEAARLPAAGAALVRRGQDAAPQRVRVALSTPEDAARIAAASSGPAPRRPWLPDLPRRVDLAEVRVDAAPGFVLGLADEPEQQRQRPLVLRADQRGLLIVGGPGSGTSTALHTLAAQAPGPVVRVPHDGEGAWDALVRLVDSPPEPGALILLDDVDTLGTRLAGEYAQAAVALLEQVVRAAGGAGVFVVAAAHRLTGAAARIADLLANRLVLATGSRAEHVAAGGDPAHYAPGAPPGRGRLGALAVQVAVADRPAVPTAPPTASPWHPVAGITGLVARRATVRGAVAAWRGAQVVSVEEAALRGDPAGLVATGPVVIVGDADDWQRAWRLLGSVRDEHALVIDVGCAAEYRILAADRSLPPYCEPGRRRAWIIRAGGAPERIALPDAPADGIPASRAAARQRRGA